MAKKRKTQKKKTSQGKKKRAKPTKRKKTSKQQARSNLKPKKGLLKTFVGKLLGKGKKGDLAAKGKLIGAITHYFPHVHAGVLILRSGQLKRGDRIYIKGHTTDFKQIVDSLQIDRVNIETAKKGDEIGIAVKKRVRVGDEVYLIG